MAEGALMDRPRPIAALPTPEPEQDTESVRWLALVLAELFRVGLAMISKRYPEARGKQTCGHCGWRG